MNGSRGPYGRVDLVQKTAPGKRIGAVSPAARATCKITPVRIPLRELGSTMVRIVCQRDAPRFQHASRNAIGTAPRASRVLAMITGRFMTAMVREAVSNPPSHLVLRSFG